MFKIEVAGLKILINNRYNYIFEQCRDYLSYSDKTDIAAEATEAEIEKERAFNPNIVEDGYLESVCIHRTIAKKLPEYNAFVFHCAAVEYRGNAYCFTAKSGTGKTTHTKLWRKTLGEELHVINGDKPILRLDGGKFFVNGTPWRGKENLGNNISVPLKGIAILSRSENNTIIPAERDYAIKTLLGQIYIPNSLENKIKTLDLIGKLAEETEIFDLKCNMSDDAAKVSFAAMNKE